MPEDDRYKPYRFAGGRIYLDVDESPMMRRRAEGTYEPFKVAALQQLLPAGGTFVDVGSNKGDFALIAARCMGPEGRVIAIEPEPENCRWIRRSVELNGYTNVELHQLALSDAEGEAPLYLGKKSGWHGLLPGEEKRDSITVRTRTLDTLLAELGTGPPDMLKIDVEGAELQVLAGAVRTLDSPTPMWILLDVHPDRGVDPQAVADTLSAHDFELRRPEHPAEALAEITPQTSELFAIRGERHRPYPFPGGLIYLDVDHSRHMLARAEGRYEPAKVAFVQRFLKPGMTFVDAGANMGDFSLIAAKTMNDEGRVLAFEPSPENCTWLRRSVELNGYRCIEVMELALSDTSGEDTFYLGTRVGRHSLVPRPHGQTLTVAVETLDAVLESTGDRRVDMVKLDVEGAELRVLRGAPDTFGGSAPLMLMVDIHGARADPEEVCGLLVEYGFSLRVPADPETELEPDPDTREVFALKGY